MEEVRCVYCNTVNDGDGTCFCCGHTACAITTKMVAKEIAEEGKNEPYGSGHFCSFCGAELVGQEGAPGLFCLSCGNS